MRTSRVEAFSDGVFAIAATLLILNLHVTNHQLSHQLLHLGPGYAAYAVSFVTIGVMWVNHHTVLDQMGRVDRFFLLANVLFLMMVAFVPFPTELVANNMNNSNATGAAVAYGVTLCITAVMFNVVWHAGAWNGRLLRADADPVVVRGITRSYRPGPFIYLAAALTALFSPWVSVAMYAAITVLYVVESAVFGRSATRS